MAFRLALVVLCASLRSSAAGGGPTTLHVDRGDPNCTDGGPGSAGQPFCTIGAAAARAVAGQTVEVAPGTYPENVTPAHSGTASDPIVFTAAPGASVTVGGQIHGFTLSGRSGITVQGFTVTGTTGDGIYVLNASGITLTDNHVSYSGQPVSGQTAKGIQLSAVTTALVARNTIDHNTDYGIYLTSSTGVQLIDNHSSFNARGYTREASGIRLFNSPANTLAGNVCHDNEDSGIEFTGDAHDNVIVSNVSYRNGDHGIDVFNSTGQWIVANSVYKNVTAGINVEGTSSGAVLANNVSVDNGIKSPRTVGNLRVDTDSIAGTRLDYDLVFLHQGTVMMVWGTTGYGSLAAFVAATGQEQHGLQADPLWVAPDAGDLHLLAGSPAIDSANSGASGQAGSDADGNPRVDDPATPDTGAGPRTYDDRGAYEFQPGGVPTTTTFTTASSTSTTTTEAPTTSTVTTTTEPTSTTEAPTTTTTTSTSTTTTTTNPALCGDVNGDGAVDIGDALVVAQFDVGISRCGQAAFAHPERCDVNQDGACNIGDALRIAQCDVGIVSCAFTCGAFTCP